MDSPGTSRAGDATLERTKEAALLSLHGGEGAGGAQQHWRGCEEEDGQLEPGSVRRGRGERGDDEPAAGSDERATTGKPTTEEPWLTH